MSNPDVTDFEVCRTLIHHCINASLANRNELFAKDQIDADDYIKRRKKFEEPLRRYAKDLTLKILEGIVEDFTHHKTRIEQVTTKLEQVSKKIQDVNKSIAFFTEVINFFGTVVTTASTGIAGIPSLLDNFEKILK